MADALGLSDSSQRVVRVAGMLHDVGKIGIPDRILRKPAGLTPAEYEIVKGRSALGEALIAAMPDLEEIHAAVVSHHERYDGAGYPHGLANVEIPLLGRILAVADACSAMTTDRPYRKRLAPEEAIVELRAGSGSQFDPEIVDAFLRCLGAPTASPDQAAVAFAPPSWRADSAPPRATLMPTEASCDRQLVDRSAVSGSSTAGQRVKASQTMRNSWPATGTNTRKASQGACPAFSRIRQKQNVRNPPSRSQPTMVRLMKLPSTAASGRPARHPMRNGLRGAVSPRSRSQEYRAPRRQAAAVLGLGPNLFSPG